MSHDLDLSLAGAQAHRDAVDTDAVQSRAHSYAVSKGISFTPTRQRVLALLAATGNQWPPTRSPRSSAVRVYRALEFLQEAACVHRLASRSAFFACDYRHGEGETVVFMVCSQCGTVQETASELVARGLWGAAKATGFKPRHPKIEVEGECAKCAGVSPI
jgi:Fur family zinc uptake transcriptional regulator